jgi:hypothetical protein
MVASEASCVPEAISFGVNSSGTFTYPRRSSPKRDRGTQPTRCPTASHPSPCLAFVYVGSGDGEIASTILQTLMERDEKQLDSEWAVFLGLALGSTYTNARLRAAIEAISIVLVSSAMCGNSLALMSSRHDPA